MMAVNFIRNEIIHRLLPQSLMLAILLGACNIYGSFDNPIDPKGENYKSPDKAITSFSLVNPSVTGTIDEATKTIELTVPYGTSPSGLKATFITTGASVRVGSTLQISGSTANDFINPVIYEVTAEDGSKTNYTVIVTVASSSAKAITNFSIASLSVAGIIDENARTINITVPFGTSITALTASFSTSGNSVSVNNVIQVSNSTSNNFTAPLVYEVVAADGTTQSYAVTVTVAPDPAKTITSFNFSSPAAVGIVTESNHTVSVTVPYGTSVTSLVPSIQITGATISPASGTSRNFTNPVSYTVTAADGSIQVYTITVTVAANFTKGITSFAFSNPSVIGVVTESNHTIAITVPFGTTVTSLTPTIGISGASISPASGMPQNFANPLTYTVTAADSTTQTYIATVTIALNPAKAITNFNFTSLGVTGVVTESNHTVALTVPYGTSVASLAPTIVITGTSISPASGVVQNFTNPVVYTVTADDTTTQSYSVIVNIALNPAKAITTFTFPSSTSTTISESEHTILVTLPYGTDTTALVPTIFHTGTSISPSPSLAQNFGSSKIYTVTAADGTMQAYTVAVILALNPAKTITSLTLTNSLNTTITDTDHTIIITVPSGMSLVSLIPTITHTGASILPASGDVQDFSSSKTYTVTAANGTDQVYTVSVVFTNLLVGDTGPSGGTIFYDKGNYSDGWRYLEAASIDQGSNIIWGGKAFLTNSNGTLIGTGKANTELIVSILGDGVYAAKICFDLTLNGYNDWYLPSHDELFALYQNRIYIRSIMSAGKYLSSTEMDDNYAYQYAFFGGEAWGGGIKDGGYYIRAIRSF